MRSVNQNLNNVDTIEINYGSLNNDVIGSAVNTIERNYGSLDINEIDGAENNPVESKNNTENRGVLIVDENASKNASKKCQKICQQAGAELGQAQPRLVSQKRPLESEIIGPFYSYIGETSRSAYERGHEHLKDLEFRRTKSHFLRHAVEIHPDVPPEKLDFRMKVLTTHKSAFERQIREAVMIDLENGPNLLNSKIEYSRCLLPKMSIKLGNKQSEEDPQITKEKDIKEKIQLLYKSENKRTAESSQNRCKKARKSPPEPMLDEKLPCMNDEIVSPKENSKENGKVCSHKKVKRSEIKLKISPKKSPVPKVSPQKMSLIPKLGDETGAPSPELTPKTGATDPDLRTQNVAPDPNLELPSIKGGKMGTLKTFQPKNSPPKKDTKISTSKNSPPHPAMVDSPSLRPVRIRNIIESFEKNIQSGNISKGQKINKMDAFGALMLSGGKGDTLVKTPRKKKPKRLLPISTTKKESTMMDNWLRKLKEN